MIFINGHPYKNYDIGPGLTVTTNVSDGRNALGEFVGQRIGRDQDKIDGLVWTMLDAVEWNAIMQEFNECVVVVKFPDMVNGGWKTERMYPGNRTATPVEFNGSGLPTKYRDCKVNIIDCGVIE